MGMADTGDPVGDLHVAGLNARGTRAVRLGVLSLCLVQFVDVLGVTVMVTALPAMLADLRASADAASLISTGYAMFFGGLLMLGARLGDRFGHRRIIFTGLAIFTVAAVLAATATSAAVLTAARCLQGGAAALSVPSALRLLTTITSDGIQRERAIAAWSAAGAAAGASGFVVGGVMTYLVGWRAVFWSYLPLAVLLAAAIGRAVPPDRARDRSVRLNVPSVSTFTAAVMAFVVATTLLPQPGKTAPGAALLVVAVVLAGAFIAVDRSSAAPLLPTAVLGERPLRQGAAGALLNTLTTSSAITLATPVLAEHPRAQPARDGVDAVAVQRRRHRRLRTCCSRAGPVACAASRLRRSGNHRHLRRRAHPGGHQHLGAAYLRRGRWRGYRPVLGCRHQAGYQRPGHRARHRLGNHQHRRPAGHRPGHRRSAACRSAEHWHP
jgi:MFS family permease